jgi:uncharacterized protein YdeI (YjbR/CyaY-like superfamily)
MPTAAKKYSFVAKIQEGRGGGAFVVFPYDAEKEFGTKGRVPVKATFNGVQETSSLMKMGLPHHIIGVAKAIRAQIGRDIGDPVDVVLWKDQEERVVEIPPDFKKRMEREKLLPFFESLSFTHRKEYCRWLTEAKKEETRRNRFEKAIDMLRKGVKTPG